MNKRVLCCDKCHKEIKYGIFPKLSGNLKGIIHFGFGSYDYQNIDFDLCEDCLKLLYKFLENKR